MVRFYYDNQNGHYFQGPLQAGGRLRGFSTAVPGFCREVSVLTGRLRATMLDWNAVTRS